jgi:hypothetical protein
MGEQPDAATLKQAAERARQRRRPVYVYFNNEHWKIADQLSEIRGSARIFEVPSRHGQGERRNWGGC